MPDFIVLKQTGSQGGAAGWTPIVIAFNVDDGEAAAKQAYTGEGTYKVLPWDDDAEVAVTPGEPEVTMVSRKAVAEERAAEEAATAKAALS